MEQNKLKTMNTLDQKTLEILKEQNIEDLAFVWKKDIAKIEADFKVKYAQVEDETAVQKRIRSFNTNPHLDFQKENLVNVYEIERKNLELISNLLEERANQIGVTIEYTDLTGFSEDDLYKNEHEADHKKHAETARSDGKILLLEKDVSKAGNIEGRIYDTMHLAFGHMVQWSSLDTMLLDKEEAWKIGYRNHEKSPDLIVDLMSLYEFEAGMFGVEALRQVIETSGLTPETQEKILQYFVDYAYADRSFIIQHYRGNYIPFESYWKFGQPIPPRQVLPKVEKFIQRHAVEIGLLREKQNPQ